MLPLSIDKFDLFILKQLFPNFKLSLEQIMHNIDKQLLKELESLSNYDLRKFHSLAKTDPLTDDHKLSCATSILFDFDYDELFYEIDTRLNEKLVKLQLEDDGIYQLTPYGLELYNRIGLHSKDQIIENIIDIKEITDLSTLKIKTIITQEYETNKKLIVTLTQQNLKQAKFNYWEITKQPIYIRGVSDELGLIKTVFYFQFTAPPQLPKINFSILSLVSKNKIGGDYLLRSEIDQLLYKIKASQIDPYVPLDPKYWNYSEGLYESIRGGIIVQLEKPVLGTGIILGFDRCTVVEESDDYLGLTTANLLDMKQSTKDKDIFTIAVGGNRVLILNWSDLESQLDLERREILKKKNALKRKDEPMLIKIEGPIRKKEIILEGSKIYFYLEEPEIISENF